MKSKKAKKKRIKDEEEEVERREKKHKKVAKEYDTKRQPLWVSDPTWDSMFQMNGEGSDGQRAYLYRERGFIVVANKDWEKDGDNLPGKSIRIKMDDMDTLLIKYMKKVYNHNFEVEQ